jgi:hypothetical protein
MDDDSVIDALDNCPATANTDQADADGNGVGEACQGKGLATGEVIGYSTADGVAEAIFDQRLRSVQLSSPGQVATLVWPDDASRVDVELVVSSIRTTSSTPVDFSDEALLAALDDAEAEGEDVAAYRQYVADYPGRIQQIVTGQYPPSLAGIQGGVRQHLQVLDPTVTAYLHRLAEAVLICRATANALRERLNQTQDPQLREHYLVLMRHFSHLSTQIDEVYDRQQRACIVCTEEEEEEQGEACNVDCVPPETTDRACCIYNFDENKVDCIDTDKVDCENNWFGEYDANYGCEEIDNCDQGACCIDQDDVNPGPPNVDLKPDCGDNYPRQDCENLNNSSLIPAEYMIYTKFYVGKECEEIKCEE